MLTGNNIRTTSHKAGSSDSVEHLPMPRTFCDFELCVGTDELKRTLHNINYSGFDLITVTQDGDVYTVFFRESNCV